MVTFFAVLKDRMPFTLSNSSAALFAKASSSRALIFQDPEHGINKKGVAEVHHQSGIGPAGFASVGSLAYSSIFPSTAVMINWHDQGRLTKIQESVSNFEFKLAIHQ